jgi:hypothetical protein
MKNFLPLIFALLVIQTSAQTSVYHPFPDSNAVWTIGLGGCCWAYCTPPPNPNPIVSESNFSYILTGDTIISTIAYHKIWKSGTTHTHCSMGDEVDTWEIINQYAGAYRNDAGVKKVYFVEPGNTMESLLYDFDLEIGDTLKGIMSPVIGYSIVTSLDSILVGGNYRSRINYYDLYSGGSWIEGIGSTTGLLENLTGPDFFSDLVCYKYNITDLYPDTISTCDILTQIKKIRIQSTFSITPNPFHTYATLQAGNEFINSELIIYNLFGQQVKEQTIEKNSVRIERNGLSEGIYFYRAMNAKGKTTTGKFIIE